MNYPIIEGNTLLNSTYGIYVADGDDGIIRNNLIMYSSLYGIYLTGSNNNYDVTLNTVENNRDGIFVAQGDWQTITNNTVRWNSRYGIYVTGAANVLVHYNIIAFSGTDNGYHSLGGTDWDDGATLGNWWDDYTPPGVYAVDGNTVDNFPMAYAPTEPLVNQPMDIYYAEGSTGNEITWLIADDYLRDWEVTIDGELWASDAWDFVDVTVGIDGLAYGSYTVVMTIWDVDLNSASDTVIIHVYDGTKPTINNEANRVAFVDGSGQSVEWIAYDLHPGDNLR
jgi:parallel beta-helix repeat protein